MPNPLESLAKPLVIAHRGASAVAPENTGASIREAIRLGAKVIEFDVRVTSDRELVLFHDSELRRLTGRDGLLEETPWPVAKTYDVGAWFGDGSFAGERILRFDEALRLCSEGGAVALVERKTGEAALYARVIAEEEAAERVIVQSFDWAFLREFRQVMSDVPVGALGYGDMTPEAMAALRDFAPEWVGWHVSDLRPDDVPILHALGAKVALWTVNDPDLAKRWAAAGADAIITDVADQDRGSLDVKGGFQLSCQGYREKQLTLGI